MKLPPAAGSGPADQHAQFVILGKGGGIERAGGAAPSLHDPVERIAREGAAHARSRNASTKSGPHDHFARMGIGELVAVMACYPSLRKSLSFTVG